MIKGHYEAKIVIDFWADENEDGLLPFDKIKENLYNGSLTKELQYVLDKEMDDFSVVRVEQTAVSLCKIEE